MFLNKANLLLGFCLSNFDVIRNFLQSFNARLLCSINSFFSRTFLIKKRKALGLRTSKDMLSPLCLKIRLLFSIPIIQEVLELPSNKGKKISFGCDIARKNNPLGPSFPSSIGKKQP